MRILRICGQNLNSLERFEIDLTKAPLVDAGLFAITGDTGAGKSTILDAVTLALYGDYPRVADAGGGLVPDPSGERIGSGDPRAILRRGAGIGHAEVHFIGIDGEGYRSHWSVARARGRSDGNPQKVGRSLYRLSDGSAVAQGKTDVAERIHALTGLTFGQFRRTVLLAQGDFDAFLMASEGDRAALLQRITDTGIYARLSSKIHEGARDRRNEVANLRMRLDGIGLMAPDEREATKAELDALQEEVTDLKRERAVLASAIERATQVSKAEQAVEEAIRIRTTASTAFEAGADEHARLAQHDAVEPLRALTVERCRTERVRVQTAETQSIAATECLRSDVTAKQARSVSEEASRVRVEADRAVEINLPLWVEAARLDRERAGAEHDERSAIGRATKAADDLKKAVTHAEAMRGDANAIERHRTGVQERLTATSDFDVLADHVDRIENLFSSYGTAMVQRALETATLFDLRIEAEATESEAGTAKAAHRSSLESRNQADRALNELRTARLELGLSSLLERKASLERLSALLIDHSRDHRIHDSAARTRGVAESERLKAWKRDAEAEARRAGAEALLRDKEAERRGLGRALERASGAASDGAATLRALLVDGQPCPVCGSREHHPAASPHLEHLAQQLRNDMDALGHTIQEASLAMVTAAAEASTAQAAAEHAERRMGEAACEMAEARETFVARARSLAEALSDCGIGESVPALDQVYKREAWISMSERMGEARHPVMQGLAEGDRLWGEIDETSTRRDDLIRRIETLSTDVTKASDRAQSIALRVVAAEVRLDTAHRGTADSRTALVPYLTAAGISPERFDGSSMESATTVAGLGRERLALRREAAEVEILTTSAAIAIEVAEQAVRDAVEADRETIDAEAKAKGALADWMNLRATLLGGEDAEMHRTRTETSARDARDAAAAAWTDHSLAISTQTAAEERHAAAVSAATSAKDTATLTARELVEGCATLGFEEVQVISLLDIPREHVDALRGRLAARVQAVRDAAGLVTARRTDFDRAVADMDGTELPEDASGRLLELDAAIDGQTRSCGALEEQLGADDERHLLAEDLEREMAVATTDLTVWAEVDEAIGSASGDRFARLAQEITLESLVVLANEQLVMIAPRFALARGDALSLHAIDMEMGGDRRASQSLSGGERFLVSLGLALALSGLDGRQGSCNVLFVDEGFGSLDSTSLDTAIAALETLQALGRKVAVVTHLAAMIERIPIQVRVSKRGSGRSVVEVRA